MGAAVDDGRPAGLPAVGTARNIIVIVCQELPGSLPEGTRPLRGCGCLPWYDVHSASV